MSSKRCWDVAVRTLRMSMNSQAGSPNMPLEAPAGKELFRNSRRALTRRASAARR